MKILFALTLLAVSNPLFAAVNLPYNNDFGTSAADFIPGSNGTWNLGSGAYTNNIPADSPSFSGVQATGLGGVTKQSFSMSTVITSASGSSGSVGFSVLSNGSNLNSSSFILADLFHSGTLRFRTFVNGSATGSDISLATSIRIFDIATLGPVTLSVSGIYNADNSLTLTLAASQGSTTTSHSATYTSADVPTGNWFGYRDRNNTGTTNVTPFSATYDSFSIEAIPEPSTVVISAAFLGFASFRRRRL